MAFFKIDTTDLSNYTSSLKVTKEHQYNAQTNAAGNTVVDYINSKREIEVEIISLADSVARTVLAAIDKFQVTVYYRNPKNGTLESFSGIIPENEVEYYTLATGKERVKAFKLVCKEL